MARVTQTLQPVAFSLERQSTLNNIEVYALPFPYAWHGPLEGLHAELRSRHNLPNMYLIDRLNSSLRALVPHILTVPTRIRTSTNYGPSMEQSSGGASARASWLLAHEPIDPAKIMLVVKAWLEITYGECDSYDQVRGMFQVADLRWEKSILSLIGKTDANGTASPDGLAYTAWPALVADHLVKTAATIQVGGESRPLLRVPSDRGAELISWPPTYLKDRRGRESGYSYKVSITLQTVVGNPQPRVHFHYGVRRWMNHPILDAERLYMGRQDTSVYLRTTEPWLGLGETRAFTLARLRAVYDGDKRVPVWRDDVPDIARRLFVNFPEADAVARDPMRWIHGLNGVAVGIVYPQPPKDHLIRPGLDFTVHEQITHSLAHALQGELTLHSPLTRVPIPQKRVAHPLMGELRDMLERDRLDGLQKSVSPNVRIEVYWTTEHVRDMLVDRVKAVLTGDMPPLEDTATDSTSQDENLDVLAALEDAEIKSVDRLDLSEPGTGRQQVTTKPTKPTRRRAPEPEPERVVRDEFIPLSGGYVHIAPIPLAGLGSPLPPGESGIRGMMKLTEQRAAQIHGQLSPTNPDEPTLALIELPNYNDPQKPEMRRQFRLRDPKRALRLGMALSGRVSQFTTTDPQETLQHRCDKSVRDGLRQLGYLPHPVGFTFASGPQLPADMLVVGVWVLRLTRKRLQNAAAVHLPVAVILHTRSHQVRAWLPDGRGIRPYRQALIDVVKIRPERIGVGFNKNGDALRALQQLIQIELPLEGAENIVVLVGAQNARRTWPALANNQLQFDCLVFDRSGMVMPATDLPTRLRIVRVRTNEQDETPEYFMPNPGPNSSAQGLWDESGTPRLYFNTAMKPNTSGKGKRGKEADPRAHFAIPSLLEVVPILLQPDDVPHVWAAAVDQWRRMSILFNYMTLLPLPLALASKMDEYAEVIGPNVLKSEWLWEEDDEEDDEEDEPEGLAFGA